MMRVVTVYVDNKTGLRSNEKDSLPVVQKRTVKRGRFKFSMVGIKIGECVTFMPTNTEVKVASDDSVEYQGRIYKLSPFCRYVYAGRETEYIGCISRGKIFLI